MRQTTGYTTPQKVSMMNKILHMYWLQILIGGILLFFLAQQAAIITQNTNFYPTVLLIGAFVVPITFVTYFYQYVRDREISLPVLTLCFVVGGILGLIAAGVLEFETLSNAGIFQIAGISFIEETVKLIFPIGMYIAWRYRHEADGLLFGVSAGMGFAALETMGYGMTSLIQAHGQIANMQQVLVVRGLLSPAGHAAWTGLVCAALWRKREHSHRFLNLSVIGTFLLAVLLHTLWNVASLSNTNTPAGLTYAVLGFFAVGAFSLILVMSRFRSVRKHALADVSNQQ